MELGSLDTAGVFRFLMQDIRIYLTSYIFIAAGVVFIAVATALAVVLFKKAGQERELSEINSERNHIRGLLKVTGDGEEEMTLPVCRDFTVPVPAPTATGDCCKSDEETLLLEELQETQTLE